MPSLYSVAFPPAVRTVMGLVSGISIPVNGTPTQAQVVAKIAPPNYDFTIPLITVARIGGTPDPDGVTDQPIMLIGCYGPDFLTAEALNAAVQVKVLTSVATLVTPSPPVVGEKAVLVDSAEIYVGEQETPDVYPDERRITSTYRFGWRRQF